MLSTDFCKFLKPLKRPSKTNSNSRRGFTNNVHDNFYF